MDEEDTTFEYQIHETLEDDDDTEGENAQRKTWESESELGQDQESPEEFESNIIETLEAEINDINLKVIQGEITFEKYNELLIYYQIQISDEKIKLMKFMENANISKNLISELDVLFSKLKKDKTKNKFDPSLVEGTIDDIFRKYGEALEKELSEENDFFFESNPITSNISNIINLPTPEKYQKELQFFEQKIQKNIISIEDIYSYLDLRFNILNDNLETNLKNDILYLKFHMDLQLEFASLRSELELLLGETSVIIDEDLDNFNKKHSIKTGVLKSRKDLLANVNILKNVLETKLLNLIKKYDSVQETLFKKKDSKEVLKIFKQLREIYIKNEFLKLERRFTDQEIINDFKNETLDFIIDKYSQYVISDYFDWASGKKQEIDKIPKYTKRVKLTDKEVSIIRESEIREYKQRKEFEKILSTLPKEILLSCVDKFIAEGTMNEPYVKVNSQDKYIDELYQKHFLFQYLEEYSEESKKSPLYLVAESNAFDPSSDLKENSLFPITKWIKIVLNINSVNALKQEKTINLYNTALDIYQKLSIDEKNKIDNDVMKNLPSKFKKQFINGIPSKGPLVFVYPPEIPDETNFEEFKEYFKKMESYIKNLTPETNPYVKIGLPIDVNNKRNKIKPINKTINKKAYSTLSDAVKNTPVGGFFILSSVENDFSSLVLDYLNDKEKKEMQKKLLSEEEIKEFYDSYAKEDKKRENPKSLYTANPKINPKLTLISNLRKITDSDEYIEIIQKIDKSFKISKIVGEQIFIEGRDNPITKINLEKMLIGTIEREYQQKNEIQTITKKLDPVISSIKWGISFNPTFQLLDLSKRLAGTYIVHTEPKYRIRLAGLGSTNYNGQFYPGWNIYQKNQNNRSIITITTDFYEYLKLFRNNLILKYENFRQLDILNYEQFTSSDDILKHIEYISNYLKDVGGETDFTIKLIKQQDANQKVRQEQKNEIINSLNFMSEGMFDLNILQEIGNEIEMEIYNQFKDIRNGVLKPDVKITDILQTDKVEHFELIKKFKKSGLPINTLHNQNQNKYELYYIKISTAIFNIYLTNNFIQDYISGKNSIKSVVDRDLTNEELDEGLDTVEKLLSWHPNTDTLNIMKKTYPDAFNKIIANGSNLIDISVITLFETETRKKMSFLNKKLALTELIKLRSWQHTIELSKKIQNMSNKFMFLIKRRNALRTNNNITSIIRLKTLDKITIAVNKCSFYQEYTPRIQELIEYFSENIEIACYSLSNNENDYINISNNILSSKPKLYKLISEFSLNGHGPVDIITNIAELYLEFGKTESSKKILSKAKLGDWDGVKNLPIELLKGIKIVANSMTEAIERKKNGMKTIQNNPEFGIVEYKITKTDIGEIEKVFTVNKVKKSPNIDETKRNMDILLKIIKTDYIPKVNDMISAEIQQVIDKNNITIEIIDELSSKNILNVKDVDKLKSFSYDKLLEIYNNFYREPTFVDVIPFSLAKNGINIYPLKLRGGFLIGGNLPLNAVSYRYRDSDGKIKTYLSDICEWIGIKPREINYSDQIDIYSKPLNDELTMVDCVKKIINSSLWIKIYNNELIGSKEVLSKIITEFDMYKSIEESVRTYFIENGGNTKLFVNGGTKEEYESFLSNTLYSEGLKKLLGISTFEKPKEIKQQIVTDYRVDVSILKNGNQTIYRKLYKSKTHKYPIPIRYDSENYPVYSKVQKIQLASLIENGHLSPWYKNKIKILKRKDGIYFEGELPFIIDESSNSAGLSSYYVEQIFKDPMYGLPIITRIGERYSLLDRVIVGPQSYQSKTVKKVLLPENKYAIKEEPFKIKFFRSELPSQSQTNDFRISDAQIPSQFISTNDLIKKSGYSIIDSRTFVYPIKYNPDDVWSWDPLKDYKVGAQVDNDVWAAEKNKQITFLKDFLRKTGSSSSAFIAAKNEATRYLQTFRINLPSQKQNEITKNVLKKPTKSFNEINIIKVNKSWKKLNKNQLIDEAKRMKYYTDDMKIMKTNEIISEMKLKLEEELKINLSVIYNLDVIHDNKDEVENKMKMYKKVDDIDYIQCTHYIEKFIENKFIIITPEVMEIIENPLKIFQNYNRYQIAFNDQGYIEILPKYNNQGAISEKTKIETIYEIVKNMSYTTNFGFSKDIIEYVNNLDLFKKLKTEDKIKILSTYPVMKIILKIEEKGLKINIWNILTIAYDIWFPVFNRGMKKEIIDDIKKRALKYTFENPIEITVEDVVNYLGDSYYQNTRYNKGIKIDNLMNSLYLYPGYKFEKINIDEISFTDKTSSVAKYVHNPFITMFRNMDDRDPKISIEMLIVGNDLHNNKNTISSNTARRCALLYNVDLSSVDAYFNLPDPNVSGKYRDPAIAINKEDVLKFLAKGGKYYTILEMPDPELKFRKMPTGDKMTVINLYRSAIKEYFKSKDRKKIYNDLIEKKRLNPLTLRLYIDRVENANISSNQIFHFIDSLNIIPDFLDIRWPYNKNYLEKEFIKKTNISFENFLNGHRRNIYINVPRPTERLYKINN